MITRLVLVAYGRYSISISREGSPNPKIGHNNIWGNKKGPFN